MKIGLLRHFKVSLGYPNRWVTSKELEIWEQEYAASEIEEIPIDLDHSEWNRCYSSDISRAQKTAKKAFDGNIVLMEELREMTLYPVFKSDIRLPLWLHVTLIRLAWFMGHKSQKETKKEVVKRINKILDQAIEQGDNVLIVGHGGIMIFMSKELAKRGFTGPKFNRPENARLYVYEKDTR